MVGSADETGVEKARVLAGRVYDTGLQAFCLRNVRARDLHSSAPGLHPTSPKCLCNAGMSKQEIHIIPIEVEREILSTYIIPIFINYCVYSLSIFPKKLV